MRIHVSSDLHFDIAGNAPTAADRQLPEHDLAICAGDGGSPGSHALRTLREIHTDTSIPLIYAPGNHCFYSEGDPKKREADPSVATTWEREREIMKKVAQELDIVLLDDGVAEIAGVRFVGGTLWTDLSARPPYMSFADAAREAEKRFSDFRNIKTGAGRSKDRFTVRDHVAAHQATRMFIGHVLATPFDGDTIVVTHHAPSYRSLSGWNPAMPAAFGYLDWLFASDMEALMTGPNAPLLWIHGHVHANRDYIVGGTRIVCNPRGYPPDLAAGHKRRENENYDPQLIIEIEPRPSLSMRGGI